ncbi:hypothetical protein RND71_021704 [Anisodus tanguticus]|uniref:Uncharacterized protein n=1 Tax=Anisodus tanguticus TaxID=243964 RepID=A0AAE1RXH4_9SOLA|nr:hypothetical protein RND71_021704 [Anisodus tanguticus]
MDYDDAPEDEAENTAEVEDEKSDQAHEIGNMDEDEIGGHRNEEQTSKLQSKKETIANTKTSKSLHTH